MNKLICLLSSVWLLAFAPDSAAVCAPNSNSEWCFDLSQAPPATNVDPVTSGALGSAFATGDFNGDGRLDLAVGHPDLLNIAGDDGKVLILFGDGNLPRTSNIGKISHPRSGESGTTVRFGAALAAFKVNQDGFDDLVIGAPGTDIRVQEDQCGELSVDCIDAGVVYFSLGNTLGQMTANFNDTINKNDCGLQPGDNVLYGSALAAGFKSRNGVSAVLYIGAPGEGVNLDDDAGYLAAVVNPFNNNTRLCEIYAPTIGGEPNRRARMGANVVAARFHPGVNALAPVAFGAPDADIGSTDNTGVPVVHFDVNDPDEAEGVYTQHVHWPPAGTGNLDHFGGALAAGDFDGDGDDDFVFAAPGKDAGGAETSGRIYVLRNDTTVMTPTSLFDQGAFAGQTPEAGDQFGSALAAGYINEDIYEDLVVGIPGEECCGDPGDEGFIAVMFGSASGLTTTGFRQFRQSDIGGVSTASARFGSVLAIADFNRDGLDDIIIGAPSHTVSGANGAGKIFIARLSGFIGQLNLGVQFSGATNSASNPLPRTATGTDIVNVQLVAGPIARVELPSVMLDYPAEIFINRNNSSGNAWACGNAVVTGSRRQMRCELRDTLLIGDAAPILKIDWQIGGQTTITTLDRSARVSSSISDNVPTNDVALLTAAITTEVLLFANSFESP